MSESDDEERSGGVSAVRFPARLFRRVAPPYASDFRAEVRTTNTTRVRAIAPVFALVHAAHVFLFTHGPMGRAPTEHVWRGQIGRAHAFMMGVAISFGLLATFPRKAGPLRARIDAWLGPTTATAYLLYSAVVAGLDQQVVTSVTPWIIGSLGLAIALVLDHRAAAFAYGLGATTFVVAMRTLQEDPSARLSNVVNGLSVAVLAFLISRIGYGARVRDFESRALIATKTHELEERVEEVRGLNRSLDTANRELEAQRATLTQWNDELEARVDAQVAAIRAHAAEIEQLNAQLRERVVERSRELAEALDRLSRPARGEAARFERDTWVAERFRVERLLAEGGMGQVYLADDSVTGLPVALKVVTLDDVRHVDDVKRFLLESLAAASVSHPGVVRTLHVDVTADGHPFQAQELVIGCTLVDFVRRRGRLPPPHVARLGAAIADVLAAAHAAGVVHRDVTPGNVMLTVREPGLRVLDFGIAMIRRRAGGPTSEGLAREGEFLGTPYFAAPEQASAPDAVDARADVYSLAMVLRFALAGELPTGAPEGARRGHIDSVEMPVDLEELLERCLAPDASARPTASEVRDRLAHLADALGAPSCTELAEMDAEESQRSAALLTRRGRQARTSKDT
ncbi:MAG: protein kinase [Polyangiales bacterium]